MNNTDENKYLTLLEDSIKHGFINNQEYFNSNFSPKLLLNNPSQGHYVLNDIQNELLKSHSFCINVAFVTKGGIAMLKSQILDFANKGGQGKLIVSPYLGFNDPDALRELLKLPNIEVRMSDYNISNHAKIFIFNQKVDNVVIIGSSNLTHNALKVNYETNLKLSSSIDGDYIIQVQEAFDRIWEKSNRLTPKLITQYEEENFRKSFLTNQLIKEDNVHLKEIVPNKMQIEALKGIQEIRDKGEQKALIISSTGTGKTFLSAFDVKRYNPKRFLFIVHREQILSKAKSDYQSIIGFSNDEACLYTSGMDISNKRFIFATIQSLSKEYNLNKLDPDFFDYILIDEVHKAAAKSYIRVMNHFTPDFILGMTATPERTDDKNIYELFDFNLAYEIRLQKALEEDMLCPFIYFGVTDILNDNELLDDEEVMRNLSVEERADFILEKAEYYGHSGKVLKGLIFCGTKLEAQILSTELNKRAYRTVALTGENSQEFRRQCVEGLETGQLDYILTVDIFNEGIDIPSVNQIIMLRNTESSIIFIQQLGRGLRKHTSKEFVTIIDFIGNYKKNYIIPLALYGDYSMNKDNYKKDLINKTQLSGITTINFEEVAKEKIFNAINQTNFSNVNIYKEKFIDLKNKLGRTPLLKDFLVNESIDPIVFFTNSKNKNYLDVLRSVRDTTYKISDKYSLSTLSFVTYELLNGKRPHELILLKLLLTNDGSIIKKHYYDVLNKENIYFDSKIIRSVEKVLSLEFFKKNDREKYGEHLLETDDEFYTFNEQLISALDDIEFKTLYMDAIETGLLRSKKYPASYTNKILEIGEKYSRKDVCRLLCWDQDESSTLYGYKTKHKTTPIFITYHKADDISETTKYEDRFINENIFHWFTRSKKTLDSKEVKDVIFHKENGIKNYLFVKKEDAENSDSYYLGEIDYIKNSAFDSVMTVKDKEVSIVQLDFKLEQPVPYEIYHYLTEK